MKSQLAWTSPSIPMEQRAAKSQEVASARRPQSQAANTRTVEEMRPKKVMYV